MTIGYVGCRRDGCSLTASAPPAAREARGARGSRHRLDASSGQAGQKGTNESFNGRFRDECLGMEWFRSRTEAKGIIETWRRHYNDVRPHSSLGGLAPSEFMRMFEKSKSNSGEATL